MLGAPDCIAPVVRQITAGQFMGRGGDVLGASSWAFFHRREASRAQSERCSALAAIPSASSRGCRWHRSLSSCRVNVPIRVREFGCERSLRTLHLNNGFDVDLVHCSGDFGMTCEV